MNAAVVFGAIHEAIEWCTRLSRVEAPDSEQAVSEREAALGLTLPALLREYYLSLGLRDIPLEALADPDPPLVFGAGSQWEPDRCKLGELLRGFAAMNRPFRDPSCDASDYSEARLVSPWTRHVLDWKSIQYDGLWTNGVAVLDVELGLLGARTHKALRQAAASLDVDLD